MAGSARPVAIITLIAIAAVAGLGYLGFRALSPPITIIDTGAQLTLTRGRFRERFARRDEFRGVFMVFGGNRVNEFRRSAAYAYMGGLPVAEARSLAMQYPDFYMCASPGAALAKNGMVHLHLVATDPAMRDRIDRTIQDHDARIDGNGERLCVTLAGHRLQRTSYMIDDQDAVITDFTPFTHVAVEEFEAQDCRAMLTSTTP